MEEEQLHPSVLDTWMQKRHPMAVKAIGEYNKLVLLTDPRFDEDLLKKVLGWYEVSPPCCYILQDTFLSLARKVAKKIGLQLFYWEGQGNDFPDETPGITVTSTLKGCGRSLAVRFGYKIREATIPPREYPKKPLLFGGTGA